MENECGWQIYNLSKTGITEWSLYTQTKLEWRGLTVAELAKSFGLPCNLPKAYASSATSYIQVHMIKA